MMLFPALAVVWAIAIVWYFRSEQELRGQSMPIGMYPHRLGRPVKYRKSRMNVIQRRKVVALSLVCFTACSAGLALFTNSMLAWITLVVALAALGAYSYALSQLRSFQSSRLNAPLAYAPSNDVSFAGYAGVHGGNVYSLDDRRMPNENQTESQTESQTIAGRYRVAL